MFLLDLAEILRATGLVVSEVPGWQTRARSGGAPYAPGRPVAVMVHHTASPPRTDGANDVSYIISGSPVAPVANLYIDRKGAVWVCAAGPTNTNGAGGPLGTVPKDQMNAHAIGIEIANAGTGEAYPTAQQDSVLATVRALTARYGISQVYSHFEWAPSRKIDPTGPSRWSPNGGKWNMNAFRDDVFKSDPTPQPAQEVDMILIKYDRGGGDWTGLSYTGTHLAHVTTSDAWSIPTSAGVPVVNVNDAQLDALIRSAETTNACPPEWVGSARGSAWTAQRG
jgi:hypothetical protein